MLSVNTFLRIYRWKCAVRRKNIHCRILYYTHSHKYLLCVSQSNPCCMLLFFFSCILFAIFHYFPFVCFQDDNRSFIEHILEKSCLLTWMLILLSSVKVSITPLSTQPLTLNFHLLYNLCFYLFVYTLYTCLPNTHPIQQTPRFNVWYIYALTHSRSFVIFHINHIL